MLLSRLLSFPYLSVVHSVQNATTYAAADLRIYVFRNLVSLKILKAVSEGTHLIGNGKTEYATLQQI